jgi:hypothetical protein
MQINNITFKLEDHGQEFSFTDATGKFHSALLQLPTTPDSQNSIDGEQWDEDEEKDAICEELRDFFYSQFKSKEHGKASIAAGFEVTHLIEVDNFYVAFSAEKAVVLKEGAASSYYNVFFFELAHHSYNEDDSESEIIEQATKKLFSCLHDSLEEKCAEYAKTGESKETVGQCFDDITHEFMKSEFSTNDYDNTEISGEFYQFYACDIRNDATNSVTECDE